jgi:hypothetical protein
MAANSVQFTATPGISLAQVSAANTNRDGSGTVVTVVAGSATGRRINKITVKAIATSTAGMVRIYLYDGTNTRLYFEVGVTAITASASIATFINTTLYYDSDAPILPSATWELRASTHNAETFNIIVEYSDY